MTFLSYAQNNEDVLLWRALGHIKNGFYIDAGANDPVEHSVTKAFYDAGWHGINIEPLPAFHQLFLDQRPRDINLAIAAGAREDSLTLFDIPAVNGWASPDRAVAEAHRAEGYEVRELTVPMRTLAAVCAEHVRGEIHFLKIDVEGFEAEVLRGMDFGKWRPWLLVIEATLPNSRVTNHETWEALVTGQRYSFAHFDGLNRYYVAEEHAELGETLAIQPNVFDNYISYHLDRAWRATEAASAAGAKASERLAEAAHKQWEAETRGEQATAAAREALAHSADLLARYDDANKQLQAAHADGAALRAQLAQAAAALDAKDAQLARAADALASQDAQLQRAELALRMAAERAAEQAAQAARAVQAAQAAQAEQAAQAAQAVQAAQAHGADLQARFDQLGVEAHRVSVWGAELEQRLLTIHASSSWRITAPLRFAGTVARKLAGSGARGAARRVLRKTVARVTSNERMRRLLIPVLLRFPGQAERVSRILQGIRQAEPDAAAAAAPAATIHLSDELRAMPVSARKVLADLERACRNHTGS